MGFEFVARTLRVTGLLTIVLATTLGAYAGPRAGLALAAGGARSLLNLTLWTGVVRRLSPRGGVAEPLRALVLAGVKGPLLYLCGWWLLRSGLPVLPMVGGFG